MSEKRAYTPAEFAALFGREKTWAYRMLYSGKVNGITDYGRIMIAASEAERISSEGTRYLGKKKAAKKAAAKKQIASVEKQPPAKGSAQWAAWIEKGMRRPGKPEEPTGEN
jgi:hypothetical protein